MLLSAKPTHLLNTFSVLCASRGQAHLKLQTPITAEACEVPTFKQWKVTELEPWPPKAQQ